MAKVHAALKTAMLKIVLDFVANSRVVACPTITFTRALAQTRILSSTALALALTVALNLSLEFVHVLTLFFALNSTLRLPRTRSQTPRSPKM